jgi:hypothetical protein
MKHKILISDEMFNNLLSESNVLFEYDELNVRKRFQNNCLVLSFSYSLFQRRIPLKLVYEGLEENMMNNGKIVVFRVRSIMLSILIALISTSLLINIVCLFCGVYSFKLGIHLVFCLVFMLVFWLSIGYQLKEFEEAWKKS